MRKGRERSCSGPSSCRTDPRLRIVYSTVTAALAGCALGGYLGCNVLVGAVGSRSGPRARPGGSLMARDRGPTDPTRQTCSTQPTRVKVQPSPPHPASRRGPTKNPEVLTHGVDRVRCQGTTSQASRAAHLAARSLGHSGRVGIISQRAKPSGSRSPDTPLTFGLGPSRLGSTTS